MTIIEQARALGAAIQADERYINYNKIAAENDQDPEIQNKIGEFNMKRSQLNEEMRKEDKDADILTTLDKEIRELYDEIVALPKMVAYYAAKEELDKLVQSVNYIVTGSANGEDPATMPETAPTCSGSCATCGGCG
ncbi:MAG: YlbF family regulator [Saccharofermentans sp.]|nr:YlbF family regulator [Saccharofermentans sp.]